MNKHELEAIVFIYENFRHVIYVVIGVLTIMAFIAAVTKTKKDDRIVKRIISNFKAIVGRK